MFIISRQYIDYIDCIHCFRDNTSIIFIVLETIPRLYSLFSRKYIDYIHCLETIHRLCRPYSLFSKEYIDYIHCFSGNTLIIFIVFEKIHQLYSLFRDNTSIMSILVIVFETIHRLYSLFRDNTSIISTVFIVFETIHRLYSLFWRQYIDHIHCFRENTSIIFIV